MKLKNDKVIVINAFSRGGSNIAWNVMQSHPHVCSAMYETEEILYPRRPHYLQLAIRPFYTNPITNSPLGAKLIGPLIDRRFYQLKLQNLNHPDNGFQSEGVPYTRQEIEGNALCLKSLDQDIELTDLMARIYEKSYFIGLVRNGYALCEGWLRRGRHKTARQRGKMYRKYVEKMLEDQERFPHYTIAKFEDILREPFGEAERLFQFADLEPVRLEKLRFKVKKVLSEDGTHQATYGEENHKYWFDRESVHELLVPNQSGVQASALSPSDRADFEREAKPVLEHFGYLE